VKDFSGPRTKEGILNFLKENTSHPWVDLDRKEDKEESTESRDDKNDTDKDDKKKGEDLWEYLKWELTFKKVTYYYK